MKKNVGRFVLREGQQTRFFVIDKFESSPTTRKCEGNPLNPYKISRSFDNIFLLNSKRYELTIKETSHYLNSFPFIASTSSNER